MKQSRILTLLACAMPAAVFAQSSFFTGTSGSSLLLTPAKDGQLLFDSSSTLLHVQYFQPKTSLGGWRLGFDLSGKPAAGSAVLWTNGALGSNVNLQIAARNEGPLGRAYRRYLDDYARQHVGETVELKGANYDEVAVEASAGTSSNKLFDPDTSTFTNQKLTSWSFAVDYWAQYHTALFLGVRAGLAHGSNVNDLTAQSFVTTSGNVTKAQQAFLASDYKAGNYAPIRADAMWQIPTKFMAGKAKDGKTPLYRNLSIDLFADKNQVATTLWRPGIGVLLSQPGGSTSFLGGVVVSWLKGKSTISVVAGLSF